MHGYLKRDEHIYICSFTLSTLVRRNMFELVAAVTGEVTRTRHHLLAYRNPSKYSVASRIAPCSRFIPYSRIGARSTVAVKDTDICEGHQKAKKQSVIERRCIVHEILIGDQSGDPSSTEIGVSTSESLAHLRNQS